MKKIVPFVDLKEQYLSIQKDIDGAIHRVVSSGNFAQSEEVTSFESEFAKYNNAKYCVSLNSGTDALILGLRALNLQPGDEVIVPSFTFIATAIAPVENGLTPVFVDVDERDYGLNLEDLQKKITPKTKAIICVHLYGQPDKISEIQDIIRKTKQKIYLIEDACQAHGATYKGKRVGTFGAFSAFSFYPTKNLGAYGDGGAVITNDKKIADKIRSLKQYGEKIRYFSEEPGINSRLDSLQASILRAKLKHLDRWNTKRKQLAQTYTELLTKQTPFIITPMAMKDREHVYHLYVIRTKKRDELQKYLAEKNISSLIHYPRPLHLQKVYRRYGYKKGDLPIVEKVASEVLSLPFYAEMTGESVQTVVDTIEKFYTSKLNF